MKKLTRGQRFALAREARRLAMECVEGTAPEMVNFTRDNARGGHCALGWVEVYAGTEVHIGDEETLVADASNYETPELITGHDDRSYQRPATDHAARQRHLVFPLLALADALEAAGASKTPKEVP